MMTLTLLLALSQALPHQLPAEVIQSLWKAAERVSAIAQSGVLCQAQVSSEQARLSAIKKERLDAQNRIAGFEKEVDLQQNVQRGKSTTSVEYRAAQVEITHARTLITNTKRYLNDITGDEKESTAKLSKYEACVAGVRTQLDDLKAPRSVQ